MIRLNTHSPCSTKCHIIFTFVPNYSVAQWPKICLFCLERHDHTVKCHHVSFGLSGINSSPYIMWICALRCTSNQFMLTLKFEEMIVIWKKKALKLFLRYCVHTSRQTHWSGLSVRCSNGAGLTVCAAADRGVLWTGVRRWLRLSHRTICPEYVPPTTRLGWNLANPTDTTDD